MNVNRACDNHMLSTIAAQDCPRAGDQKLFGVCKIRDDDELVIHSAPICLGMLPLVIPGIQENALFMELSLAHWIVGQH